MKQNKYIRVPQRVISWGEKMHLYQLQRAQQIKDSKLQKQAARKAKKLSHSKPDNL